MVRSWKNETCFNTGAILLHFTFSIFHFTVRYLRVICTRSWNAAWHLLLRSSTESKNIVILLAISQTIHTVCCEDDYFPKENFKSFNSLFHSVYPVFPKSWFLLPICLPYVICGSYETKINVVLWRSARQTFASLGSLRSHVLRAYCNFESKEANSTTLFGPHPNDKIEWRNHTSN